MVTVRPFFLLIALLAPALAYSGDWTRTSRNSLSFTGYIQSGEVDRFKAAYHEGDQTLIVNSKGGDAEVGVRLGMELVAKKLNIIVDGFCASSCANYVFTSGVNKFIKSGFVGYHGNLTAFLEKEWSNSVQEMNTADRLIFKNTTPRNGE